MFVGKCTLYVLFSTAFLSKFFSVKYLEAHTRECESDASYSKDGMKLEPHLAHRGRKKISETHFTLAITLTVKRPTQ